MCHWQALHILSLSPKYTEVYDFEWVSGKCPGSAYTDELPFTGKPRCFAPGSLITLTKEEEVYGNGRRGCDVPDCHVDS